MLTNIVVHLSFQFEIFITYVFWKKEQHLIRVNLVFFCLGPLLILSRVLLLNS